MTAFCSICELQFWGLDMALFCIKRVALCTKLWKKRCCSVCFSCFFLQGVSICCLLCCVAGFFAFLIFSELAKTLARSAQGCSPPPWPRSLELAQNLLWRNSVSCSQFCLFLSICWHQTESKACPVYLNTVSALVEFTLVSLGQE